MVQGGGKLTGKKRGGKKNWAGAKKRKQAQKAKRPQKGRKFCAPKGRKAGQANEQLQTTKAINRKNEALVSAKAIGAGDKFFLSDIKESGKKVLGEQAKERFKKENKSKNVSDRLKDQLRKLGREDV